MAINSFGYPGAIDAPAWSRMSDELGQKYGVADFADWRVTPVVGPDRTVAVAAGTGFGRGVLDVNTAPFQIQLDAGTGTNGTVRYDLIVARRTWGATNATTFVKVNGTNSPTIPSGRLIGPGVQDDQPLALVKITTGSTVPVIEADFRTWPSKIVTATDLRALVDSVFGDKAFVGGVLYSRDLDGSSNPIWQPANTDRVTKIASTPVIAFPSLQGTNNFNITAAINIPSRPYARTVTMHGRVVASMTVSASQSPAIRFLNGVNEYGRAGVALAPNGGGHGSTSDAFALPAGATASITLNLDIPAGSGMTTFSGAGGLTVTVAEGADPI